VIFTLIIFHCEPIQDPLSRYNFMIRVCVVTARNFQPASWDRAVPVIHGDSYDTVIWVSFGTISTIHNIMVYGPGSLLGVILV